MKKRVCVIGLGIVGSATFRAMYPVKGLTMYGVDLRDDRVRELMSEGFPGATFVTSIHKLPEMDWYSVCVYSCSQVQRVVSELLGKVCDSTRRPMIVIESTMDLETGRWVRDQCSAAQVDVSVMPHRLMPGDPDHQIFNLDRVIAASNNRVLKKVVDFYGPLFEEHGGCLWGINDWDTAVVSKLLDNSYRYLQIAFAEELRLRCEETGLDFECLRRVSNTKWNINILEARDGIGGTCLPKDIELIKAALPGFSLLECATEVDGEYRERMT